MISKEERKKYVLLRKTDREILKLAHEIEKRKTSAHENMILRLIRTQLERDWRKPLLQMLKEMKKNSKLKKAEREQKLKEFIDKHFWRPD